MREVLTPIEDHEELEGLLGNPHGLDYTDVGADPSGAASSAVGDHEGIYDHDGYLLASEAAFADAYIMTRMII